MTNPPQPQPSFEEPEEMSLGEWLSNLWEGRYTILGVALLVMATAAFYLWVVTPIYQIEAILQVEEKKTSNIDRALAELDSLFSGGTQAQTEIQILKSGMVLGRTIESLGMDISAQPVLFPLIGRALVRRSPDRPWVEVESLLLPDHLRGKRFTLTVLEDGSLRWDSPGGLPLATGKPGQQLVATLNEDTLKLRINAFKAKPGQRFILVRQPLQTAIAALRESMTVAEKGKQTGVLGLTYKHASPARGAQVLNEILQQYVRQNVERKSEEVGKTLAFLQTQMPVLKARLDEAEDKLNQFRMRSGSVDLPQEAQLLLKQSLDLETQILALKQKKEELLRIYKEDHDVVATLNLQLAKLNKESQGLEGKVRALPNTQQEVVRFTRDVQVATQLYTALLNNIQQLQVVQAGQIGNARIVDRAMSSIRPVSPQPTLTMGLSVLLGVLAGVGVHHMRKLMHRAVEDPRLIEAKLGLPVYITIPHSIEQKTLYRQVEARSPGIHLLAHSFPDDLATESLRSLRTTLHFTMVDAANRAILVVGPSPGIGKSFFCANFAAVLAQSGQRVLLVDADMRKGRLHRYFGHESRKGGLSEILSGQIEWKAAAHATEVPGLEVVLSGALPPNPAELLLTSRFASFFEEACQAYDYVVFDSPPLLAVTDASIIGARAATTLLLAKSGEHPLDELNSARKRLLNSGVHLNGCVFNNVPVAGLGYRYYRYAYHYHYK